MPKRFGEARAIGRLARLEVASVPRWTRQGDGGLKSQMLRWHGCAHLALKTAAPAPTPPYQFHLLPTSSSCLRVAKGYAPCCPKSPPPAAGRSQAPTRSCSSRRGVSVRRTVGHALPGWPRERAAAAAARGGAAATSTTLMPSSRQRGELLTKRRRNSAWPASAWARLRGSSEHTIVSLLWRGSSCQHPRRPHYLRMPHPPRPVRGRQQVCAPHLQRLLRAQQPQRLVQLLLTLLPTRLPGTRQLQRPQRRRRPASRRQHSRGQPSSG